MSDTYLYGQPVIEELEHPSLKVVEHPGLKGQGPDLSGQGTLSSEDRGVSSKVIPNTETTTETTAETTQTPQSPSAPDGGLNRD